MAAKRAAAVVVPSSSKVATTSALAQTQAVRSLSFPLLSPLLLPMPNFGPVATLLAADLPPALSGLLGTH